MVNCLTYYTKVARLVFLLFFLLPVSLHAQVADFTNNHFEKADSVAALYPKHSLDDLRVLSHKLTKPLSSEVDQFRAIFKWVCDNIDNDYYSFVRNKKKRDHLKNEPKKLEEWNKKFSPLVYKRLVKEHKTVCTGYAYLIKELAYHAGLEAEIIHGYGRTAQSRNAEKLPNHSWNAVKLDGKWYLSDATWSSGAANPTNGKFIKQFDDVYFLTDPKLFALNHYPLDKKWSLTSFTPTLTEFWNAPIVYKGAFRHFITPKEVSTFDYTLEKEEGLSIDLNISDTSCVKNITLKIVHDGKSQTIVPKISRNKDHTFALNHMFKRKGNYILHVIYENDHLFTHRIKVLKRGLSNKSLSLK